LFSTILVLPLTPVFLGRVDPKSLSFWLRLPLSILGVLGPIALFFLVVRHVAVLGEDR